LRRAIKQSFSELTHIVECYRIISINLKDKKGDAMVFRRTTEPRSKLDPNRQIVQRTFLDFTKIGQPTFFVLKNDVTLSIIGKNKRSTQPGLLRLHPH
ncbi:hypothetical protein H5410_030998, partial [Solanum commersonii]